MNCLSGINALDGLVVLATCNDINKIDSALSRPGRLDRVVKFDVLDKNARTKIAESTLSDFPEQIDMVVEQGNGESGAQFKQRCAELALNLFWNKGFNTEIKPQKKVAKNAEELLKRFASDEKVTSRR